MSRQGWADDPDSRPPADEPVHLHVSVCFQEAKALVDHEPGGVSQFCEFLQRVSDIADEAPRSSQACSSYLADCLPDLDGDVSDDSFGWS